MTGEDLLAEMAGVAELQQSSDVNACDSFPAPEKPAESPANPGDCRTLGVHPEVAAAREMARTLLRARPSLPSHKHSIGSNIAEIGLFVKTAADAKRVKPYLLYQLRRLAEPVR
ncbi:hypothetical protein IC762_18010 [Bradyrhizobium genosp. L]|uniref:hypothetical protein n=1 Tax=Bradyrhizobium genosp. L TaxID=83637 RepID=UPI0018A25C4A|nr:hypothetical protein [Bradyrhizobium genosp. L]QPF81718.1 hypothetical protein IC762_18010 [Bradyrhizobium genosp. L]